MSEPTDKPALTVEMIAEWCDQQERLSAERYRWASAAGAYSTATDAVRDQSLWKFIAAAIRNGELPK